ncbi:methyl-accepting chemotaxis sensory transducer with Cache sensor [Paraburkholderia sp. BL27I4N3]|uniref:methyl-accepting chemotaxis protein n=1 Tax=Paraburkholderia sp. BL27I4N3 TaxID=1938805 RepID=UPI000E283D15|nr:methyl-accepting chemotaxis protein [Paraburkholderia sp. BL27I4N3]REE07576.1 methyl-accepting chemotaxis sensory transducer with Cache sensor [Paraburkholderia sp. BL27I4N3]
MPVRAHSISVKLTLIFGAALTTTIIAITLFATLNVRRLAEQNFNESSIGHIRQIDMSLKDMFRLMRDNVMFVSNTPVVQSADETVTNYLTHGGAMTPDKNGGVESQIYSLFKSFGESHGDLRYVYLGTKWGGYIQWPQSNLNSRYDPRDRPFYDKGIQSQGEVRRTPAYRSFGDDNGAVISFVRPVRNAQGQLTGVFGMDISLNSLAKMVAQVRFGGTGYLMIVEDGGNVLVDPHNPANAFKSMKELGGGYRDLAQTANGARSVELDGIRYDSVVYTSPDLGWKYIGLIPRSEMMAAANRLTLALSFGGVLLVIGSLVLTIVLGRRLTEPLRQLAHGMQEIASGDGDLTRRLPVTSGDEVGILAMQFNAFVEKLNRVLLDIRASSETVRISASEIAAGNADLSQRTEQQACALEETAASMEQLTSTVRNNADNARQASTLAVEATDVAHRGNDVVERVAHTMSAINKSSGHIAEITTLIEGIAFQTNILALNASVEAARAGEQGRGFAVVAGEVRSLAQRSSVAAKEIKELLDSSVAGIQQGFALAGEAGQTMSEMTRSVSRVASITGEIATASDEQSRGIEQVNFAIAQMDDVTQKNAALVEEAAAASRSLEQEGRLLNEVIAGFQLRHHD